MTASSCDGKAAPTGSCRATSLCFCRLNSWTRSDKTRRFYSNVRKVMLSISIKYRGYVAFTYTKFIFSILQGAKLSTRGYRSRTTEGLGSE